MAFGDGNLDRTAKPDQQEDLAHLLYSDQRPQNKIIQADQDNLPSLIYTHRPPLRDNGPPVTQAPTNDGHAPYGVDPRSLYPGHGAPYTQYPMAPATPAPQTDMPRVTINPGPQIGTPGSGRTTDRNNDIGYRQSSDNSGIAWGKWVDVGAQGLGGWYVRKYKMDDAKEGIDRLTPKTEKKLTDTNGSLNEYSRNAKNYYGMLQQRYEDVQSEVEKVAKEKSADLGQIIKNDKAAADYATNLTEEQAEQLKVYRQFKTETAAVKTGWEAMDDLKDGFKTPVVKPTIPLTPDAPGSVFGAGAKNPWAIKIDSTPSIVASDFSKASDTLAADLAVASREEGAALKAVSGTNLRKLLFGYGADFALEHTMLKGSSPGLITWGADVGAAFLTTKPWGVAKTVGAMVGVHLLGRIGDSITHTALE